MKQKIKLLLVDDHPVVRKGIRLCLAKFQRFDVVGEAQNGTDALAMIQHEQPEIVLMDFQMPGMNGLETTKLIHQQFPKVKVLILSVQQDKYTILQIVRSGARGYILKDASPEELVHAIESVQKGEAFFSPNVAQFLLDEFITQPGGKTANQRKALTERELEVLTRIAEGASNKEVASKLHLSVRTIEAHRERIMRKLEVRGTVELMKYAIAHGIIAVK